MKHIDNYEILEVVADNIPSLVAYFDLDCKYIYANASYKKWFNLENTEILGKHLSDVVGEKPFLMLKPSIDKIFAGETDSVSIELQTPYKTGGDKYVRVQLMANQKKQSPVQGVVVMVTDLTERRQSELAEISARKKAEALFSAASFIINSDNTDEIFGRMAIRSHRPYPLSVSYCSNRITKLRHLNLLSIKETTTTF